MRIKSRKVNSPLIVQPVLTGFPRFAAFSRVIYGADRSG